MQTWPQAALEEGNHRLHVWDGKLVPSLGPGHEPQEAKWNAARVDYEARNADPLPCRVVPITNDSRVKEVSWPVRIEALERRQTHRCYIP